MLAALLVAQVVNVAVTPTGTELTMDLGTKDGVARGWTGAIVGKDCGFIVTQASENASRARVRCTPDVCQGGCRVRLWAPEERRPPVIRAYVTEIKARARRIVVDVGSANGVAVGWVARVPGTTGKGLKITRVGHDEAEIAARVSDVCEKEQDCMGRALELEAPPGD